MDENTLTFAGGIMQLSLRNKFLLPTAALIIVGMGISTVVAYVTSKNALEEAIKNQITQKGIRRRLCPDRNHCSDISLGSLGL